MLQGSKQSTPCVPHKTINVLSMKKAVGTKACLNLITLCMEFPMFYQLGEADILAAAYELCQTNLSASPKIDCS